MSGTGIGHFTVGEHTYKYTELAPVDALRFGAVVTKAIGPALAVLGDAASSASGASNTKDILTAFGPALGLIDEEKLLELINTALQRVYTPQNECLGDEVVFNNWFQQHKTDLFQVGLLSLYHLTKDFFPRALATAVRHSPK